MEFSPNILPKPYEGKYAITVPRFKNKIEELSTDPTNKPKQFLTEVLNSILKNVVKSTEDLIKEKYKNEEDPYYGDFRMVQIMKTSGNVSMSSAFRWL